jgi:hypothetical protein
VGMHATTRAVESGFRNRSSVFGSKRQVNIALKELQAGWFTQLDLCRGAGRRCRVSSAISVLSGRESG